MKVFSGVALFFLIICASLLAIVKASDSASSKPESWVISGFRDVAREQEIEKLSLIHI